ncbi:Uncharacterised protein [uncultured archaeon]|nr:Uncharacterised protein [uncultured archaeon]
MFVFQTFAPPESTKVAKQDSSGAAKQDSSRAAKQDSTAKADSSSARAPAVDSKEWYAQVRGQANSVLAWMGQADKVNKDPSIAPEDRQTFFFSIGRKLYEDASELNRSLLRSKLKKEPEFEIAITYLNNVMYLMGNPPSVEKLSMSLAAGALNSLSARLDQLGAGGEQAQAEPKGGKGAQQQAGKKVDMKGVPKKTEAPPKANAESVAEDYAKQIKKWVDALAEKGNARMAKRIQDLAKTYYGSATDENMMKVYKVIAEKSPIRFEAASTEQGLNSIINTGERELRYRQKHGKL